MPPRIFVHQQLRSLAFRPRLDGSSSATPAANPRLIRAVVPRRNITADEKPLPTQEDKKKPGPNQQQLPHVSEEAAAMGKITGEGGPEIEQGTPVQDILARDEEAKEKAPKVVKDEINSNSSSSTATGHQGPKGSRSYSTSARRLQQMELQGQQQGQQEQVLLNYEGGVNNSIITSTTTTTDALAEPGLKFEMPSVPIGPHDHKDFRYDPLVKQVTGLLTKDGKLAKAQSHVARVLNHLRTSPPPKINPARPLLPGSPPPHHLPLNPVLYLQLAIDSVAPLLKLKSVHGLVGGGMTAQVPTPLRVRQRRRVAFKWIVETASKKSSRSSGKGMFAQKLAEEVIAVVEGKSGVWEKRALLHRMGTTARSNIGKKSMKR